MYPPQCPPETEVQEEVNAYEAFLDFLDDSQDPNIPPALQEDLNDNIPMEWDEYFGEI